MDEPAPQSLKIAGVIQILSGVLNLGLGWWLSSCVVSSVCGLLTLGFGGQLCGMVSCLLVPLGLVEVGVGIYALLDPRGAATPARIVSYLEIAAILGGGLTSLLAGAAVVALYQRDDVVLYLEG